MRFLALLLLLVAPFAVAAPYNVTLQSDTSTNSTGGTATTKELWRDCDTTPVLVDADLQPPESYPGLLTTPGTYQFCIRGRNQFGLGDVGALIPVVASDRPGPVDGGVTVIVVSDAG